MSAPERILDFVCVGGGPAGIFAALRARELHPDRTVRVLEKGKDFLAKILVSGGGRCNLTNACTQPGELARFYPRGGRELIGPLTRFGPAQTAEWFSARGVELKAESDGRVFPRSDSARTVYGCLLSCARASGVELCASSPVLGAAAGDGFFRLDLPSSAPVFARRLLIATGGSPAGHALARALGHTVVPPVPSLFCFRVEGDSRLDGLAGLSVRDVRLSLPGSAFESSGDLLITHRGLSGPAVLRLSSAGARFLADRNCRAALVVRWLGTLSLPEILDSLKQAKSTRPAVEVGAFNPFSGSLPARLWQRLSCAGGSPAGTKWGRLSGQNLQKIADELFRGSFSIAGRDVNKSEFVTCGGVDLREVDFRTMQSKIRRDLYFAGEALDVDALTGGFNFQNAWTTAWIAGGCP